MIFDFEHPSELYTNTEKCLEYCRSIPKPEPKRPLTDIHFFWRVPGEFGRKQAMSLKAAVVSQPHMYIVLWSNVDLSGNEWFKPLADFVSFQIYDPKKESMGTPLEGFNHLDATDEKCYLDGDLFKLLILYKHSGVYCDCDMVLLRDLSPLLDNEFMYQWGTCEGQINGAIMRLFWRSRLAFDLLTTLKTIAPSPGVTLWDKELYSAVRKFNKNWIVYPSAFFNTEWQLGVSTEPFEKHEYSTNLYEGCFAWHWHNRWDRPIEEGSKFEIIESMVNKKFDELRKK
jgi:Glycosyltransferase sugar-binding region containing DXD motif